VSKNYDSHCAGTTKVVIMSQGKERLKRKAFRWHVETDCSKYGQRQQGRPDHRQRTAVYDGQSAMMGSGVQLSPGLWISLVKPTKWQTSIETQISRNWNIISRFLMTLDPRWPEFNSCWNRRVVVGVRKSVHQGILQCSTNMSHFTSSYFQVLISDERD